MNQQTFVTEPGHEITVEQKLQDAPYGWTGSVSVKGVINRDGNVEQSEDPEFYGVYYVLKDGFEMWAEDFKSLELANQFADALQDSVMAKAG